MLIVNLNLANGLIRPYKKGCVSAIWTYNLMPQKNLIPKFTRKTVGPQNKRLRQSLLSINSKTKKFPRSGNFPFRQGLFASSSLGVFSPCHNLRSLKARMVSAVNSVQPTESQWWSCGRKVRS